MSVVVQISGGLGNQMFQYAMGRALSVRHGVPLLLDLSWFQNMQGSTPREFQLEVFPALKRENACWRECTSIEKKELCHVPIWKKCVGKLLGKPFLNARHILEKDCVAESFAERINVPVYLQGYWQNAAYFDAVSDVIAEDFAFGKIPVASEAMAREIAATEHSVFVHIRRGDYVSDSATNAFHGVCSTEYYEKALQHIQTCAPQATLYLFSDASDWVRDNFDTQGLRSVVVDLHDETTAYHDMYLMSLCRHHVIANSSFSWWGAWLSRGNGMTVAPQVWFSDPKLAGINPSLKSWTKL